MTMINAFDASTADRMAPAERALIERRQALLGPAYRLFYAEPVHVVRGEGVWLFDPAGERYLDVYNNVACVGHCHPHVVAAMARQAGVLNTHTRYVNETILDYADKLLGYFPPELSQVMFTCTGSEANDLAIRVARSVTGGTGVIVTSLAYHGVTIATAEMSPSLGAGSTLGEHVRTIPAPDRYRNGPAVGEAMAAAVREAVASMRAAGIKPAALLVDTIFSSDGVFADPPGFLLPAAEAIRAEGGLFIADEVQPGFARTGEAMWGFMRHGVVPDLVTLGKPMGNGYPVAAMVARPGWLAEFGARTRYFNTFGGNPVACATARAVLEVIEDEALMANALAVGRLLQDGLRALAGRYEAIGDVRGAGLFVGVELVRDRGARTPDGAFTAQVVNALRQRRILISASGPYANVLKVRPPLVFRPKHAEQFLDGLEAVLRELS